MQVMVFWTTDGDLKPGDVTPEQMAEMSAYYGELAESGIMISGGGLQPSASGVRVNFSGTDRTVVDGPFTEAKELIAGYALWQVDSMEEAIEWAQRGPNPGPGKTHVEIRPLQMPEDFDQA